MLLVPTFLELISFDCSQKSLSCLCASLLPIISAFTCSAGWSMSIVSILSRGAINSSIISVTRCHSGSWKNLSCTVLGIFVMVSYFLILFHYWIWTFCATLWRNGGFFSTFPKTCGGCVNYIILCI